MLKQFTILIFLCSWAISFAQEPIRYTTKQGLPSNHIYDIQEDANGFMWFATNRGLAKFDGETFKTFTIQDGLPNNDTWLLELDNEGRMWYFSKSNEQGYIKNDSIYKFQTEDKKVISPRFNFKTKDSLWFFSNGGIQTVKGNKIKEVGLYSKSRKTSLNEWTLKEIKKIGLTNYTQLVNPETRELAFFTQNELFFYDWDFNFISKIKQHLSDTYSNNKVDSRGLLFNQVYFNAFDTGVLFINFNDKTSQYLPFKEYVNIENVNYFRCKGLKDEIQIAIPGHLLIFNYNLELIANYSFPEISNNRISYKDSRGNIWLADFIEGVTLIPNSQLQTTYSLRGKKVQKIGQINKQLIAGVNDVGFFKYLRQSNTTELLIGSIANSNGEIYQIKEKSNYLISARKSFSFNNRILSQIKLNFVEGFTDVEQYSFKDIIHFNTNKYFITSDFLIKKTQNKYKVLARKSGLLQGLAFKKHLYISGSDGLYLFKSDSLIKPIINNDNLLNVSIKSMLSIENHLIIGTDGRGVYCYDEKEVFHLKETDGLSIQRIIKQDSCLWLATQLGVKKVSLNSNDLTNSKIADAFYEADGLLQNNTNDIYLEDNLLYAASDIGLAKLDLKNKVYLQKPKLYFKSKSDTLSFKNSERDNISITFAAQNYGNQENLKYAYRLLPTLKEWIQTDTKILNFTNLSPNLYELEIKAIDQHNNSNTIKQYLNVIPEWWQTTIAKIGFVLISIFGFWLFIKGIKIQIRKKEEEKNQLDRRISGLELQALRSQMNPHFVHNSLNAIQYFIQRNEVELSENYLVKFSKLIRLFFEYSRRQSISIKEELELLINYLDIEKLRFEEKLNYTISVDDNIDTEEQLIPSMLLQPIIENAVNHGLFHKIEKGEISIHIKQLENQTFQVLVEDDGIGIHKSKSLYEKPSKNYQSNSSAVLKERLDLLNKTNEWKINYEIMDRSDLDKSLNGTRVTITFKELVK